MAIDFLPLYNQYFPLDGSAPTDWDTFQNKNEELSAPLSSRKVDFSICDMTWADHAKAVASVALKFLMISYGLYFFGGFKLLQRGLRALPNNFQIIDGKTFSQHLKSYPSLHKVVAAARIALFATTLRYIVQRLIMIPLYPAQSRFIKLILPFLDVKKLNTVREEIIDFSRSNGWICRDIVLEKNGVRYSGMLMGHPDTIDNGNWALQATGNGEPIEHTIKEAGQIYHQSKFNVLMINGPAVGKSEGHATPQSMGDVQDVGITFLETAIKANKIVIAGRSLGGASIGVAILKHNFKKDKQYLVVRQMSFDRASNICGKIAGLGCTPIEWIVSAIVRLCGCEMDSVAASKRLQKLKIQEVIVQASHIKTIREGRQAYPGEFLIEAKDPSPTVLNSNGKLISMRDIRDDGAIPATASLGYALINGGITENKVFHCLPQAQHMTNRAISVAKPQIEAL